jgi:hypothetical protein
MGEVSDAGEAGAGTRASVELAGQYLTRMGQTGAVAELQRIGGELTPAVKQRFVGKDLARVRQAYADRLADLKGNGSKAAPQRTEA